MPALVVNENFPAPSTVVLRTAGLDVLAIGEAHPGMNDRDVLALACLQSRWLLTFDTDYAELVFHRYLPPPSAILLIRATRYRADEPAQWVLPLTQTPSDIQGFFCVVSRGGLHKRPFLVAVPTIPPSGANA
jgi:predicted nuclease of predicted toxin-antitoxin system